MVTRIDGQRFELDDRCVTVDHQVTSFTVVIRSMRPVSEESVKNLIQQQFEVVGCRQMGHDTYVR